MSVPLHVKYALADLGKREIRGGRHNPDILKYFELAGHPEIKDDETAWCAAFAGAKLEQAGIGGSGSLLARSYMKWGKPARRPRVGDIAVYPRGKSWQGHVGIVVEVGRTHITMVSGNSANMVRKTRHMIGDELGFRRPPSLSASRTVKAAGLAMGAEAGRQALTAEPILSAVQEITGQVQGVADAFQWAQYALIGLSVVSLGLIVWARIDDLQKRGR